MNPGPSCEQIQDLLSDYAEGELADKERSAVEAHLASCKPCTGELTLTRALVLGLHRIPTETAPPAVMAAIQRRLPAKASSPAIRNRPPVRSFKPWHIFSAAAAAATAFAVFLLVPRIEKPTAVNSSAASIGAIATLSLTARGVTVDGAPVGSTTLPLKEGAHVEVPLAPGSGRSAQGAQIAFADGSTVSVSSGSKLVLGADELKLDSGDLDLAIEKQKLHFRVRTPEALVTVWGTKYHVSHHSITAVDVSEGKVQVEPARGGEAGTLLVAGQRVEVDGGHVNLAKPVTTPEPAKAEDTRLPLGDDR